VAVLIGLSVLGLLLSLAFHIGSFLGWRPPEVLFEGIGFGVFIVVLPAVSLRRGRFLAAPAWMKVGCILIFVYALAAAFSSSQRLRELDDDYTTRFESSIWLVFYAVAGTMLYVARRRRETAADEPDRTWPIEVAAFGPSCHRLPFPIVIRGARRSDGARPAAVEQVFVAIRDEAAGWPLATETYGLEIRFHEPWMGSAGSTGATMLGQSIAMASCGRVRVEPAEGGWIIHYEVHLLRHFVLITAMLVGAVLWVEPPAEAAWGFGLMWGCLYCVVAVPSFTSLRRAVHQCIAAVERTR